MQGTVQDKILHPLAGKPVWRHSFDAFHSANCIQSFVIVYRDNAQKEAIQSQIPPKTDVHFTPGGLERQDSVWAGLKAAPSKTQIVLIHDCARPLITAEAIVQAISAAQETGAACVARKTTDTIKRCTPDANGSFILETIDRSTLWSMETPQTFQYPLIKDAYQNIIENKLPITDDLSAIES
ncbi:MAG: 2-C-methyl-D-erythritol 4-phosphate cytidylyltransferase, partial [Verrucomicrobiota bacterium]